MQWLSRTIAVLIFMVGPGIAGSAIDRWLKLNIFTPIGFGIGIALATLALLVLAKHFVPVAHGRPLRDEEDNSEEDSVDQDNQPLNRDVPTTTKKPVTKKPVKEQRR